MEKRQCSAGASASLCLSQWTILKMSLAKLGCTRLNWWRIGTPRNSELFDSELPRLLTPFMSTSNKFCLDTEKHFNDGGDLRAIFPKENTVISLTYILSILNSKLGEFYHQNTAKLKRDGYYEYYGNVLENFPIRKINFTTPPDRRQQALQNAIAFYNQFQLDHDPDPLLAQVNHHLIQQPEEADIIHDLLAHLAEQMIELNKQKQAETKSFLQWFERFIGCPIDTLTNKSKVQNYLGDYYKKGADSADTQNDTGAPHLSFDALIELLKKNKKKIKIDPVARKEQQTLEKEYQDSLNTLLPLKMQLMRCDRLIDAIVYRLYGLTEDEIAIVEGTSGAIVEGKNGAIVEGKNGAIVEGINGAIVEGINGAIVEGINGAIDGK